MTCLPRFSEAVDLSSRSNQEQLGDGERGPELQLGWGGPPPLHLPPQPPPPVA